MKALHIQELEVFNSQRKFQLKTRSNAVKTMGKKKQNLELP